MIDNGSYENKTSSSKQIWDAALPSLPMVSSNSLLEKLKLSVGGRMVKSSFFLWRMNKIELLKTSAADSS